MRRTSSRCSIRLHPGQNARCTCIVETSEVRMSIFLDTSTKAPMAKIMVQYGSSSRSSWAKPVRSSFCKGIMEKAIRESSITIRLGKSSTLRMLIREMRKRTILVCVCGRKRTPWQETKYQSYVENMWTVHPQIQHVQSCTAWSHVITRTSVAQAQGLHIFVSPKQLSSTCHVSSFAAPDTDHQHKFSLTHVIHFSYLSDCLTFAHRPCDSRPIYIRYDVPRRINTNLISHRLWAQIGWDQCHRHRSDRAWRPRAQKNWAWQESWDRSVSKTWKICESRCIPIMTQRRALQILISKMENYEKIGFTTVFAKSRRLWILSNANRTGETCCIVFRREEQVQSVLKLITRE